MSTAAPPRPLRVFLALASVPFPLMAAFFAWRHRADIPLGDMLFFNVPVAVAVQRGEGIGAAIMQPVLGVHYHVPMLSFTALLSMWMNWNLHYEIVMLLAVLAVGYGLLLALLWREGPAVFWGSLLPATALTWTVNQDPNLYIGLHGVWLLNNLWMLAAVLLLAARPNATWAVIGAGLCGLAATFTLANGIVLFVALLPLLWFRQRSRQTALLWGGLFALTLLLWFLAPEIGPNTINDHVAAATGADTPLWWFGVHYTALLGSPLSFVFVEYATAVIWGIVGLLLLAANVVYLYRTGAHDTLLHWGSLLLFVLGSLALVSYGRYRWGLFFSQRSHYVTLTLLFWVGTFVLTIRSLTTLHGAWWRRMALVGATAFAIFHALSVMEIWYGKQWYTPAGIATYTACLEAYPTTGDTDCFTNLGFAPPEDYIHHIDDMITYRLGLYRDLP